MSKISRQTPKGELPFKTPYNCYYPHSLRSSERRWNQGYYQAVSIDPARKNYAIRIERRYHDSRIIPIVFDKTSIESFTSDESCTMCNTYEVLTAFLEKYEQFYADCHFI